MKDFKKHMMNIHPCLVEYLEGIEKKISTSKSESTYPNIVTIGYVEGDIPVDVDILYHDVQYSPSLIDRMYNANILVISLTEAYYISELYISRGDTYLYLDGYFYDNGDSIARFRDLNGHVFIDVNFNANKFMLEIV